MNSAQERKLPFMKYIVIRDDDISYFTNPKDLEIIYRPLLEQGKGVSLSVIPEAGGGFYYGQLNGPFWERDRLGYAPFIPPEHREQKKLYPVFQNEALMEYLQNRPNFEIVQHGFQHSVIDNTREGTITNVDQLNAMWNRSSDIMKTAFGKQADFFVVPWDDASRELLTILKREMRGVSLHRVGQRHLPLRHKPAAAMRRFMSEEQRTPHFKWDDFLLLEYPGPYVSMFNNEKNMLPLVKKWLDAHDTLILVSHYWEFFYDSQKLNMSFYNAWCELLDFLLNEPDYNIISFKQLYEIIYQQ